jgi:hypothetical protein
MKPALFVWGGPYFETTCCHRFSPLGETTAEQALYGVKQAERNRPRGIYVILCRTRSRPHENFTGTMTSAGLSIRFGARIVAIRTAASLALVLGLAAKALSLGCQRCSAFAPRDRAALIAQLLEGRVRMEGFMSSKR